MSIEDHDAEDTVVDSSSDSQEYFWLSFYHH